MGTVGGTGDAVAPFEGLLPAGAPRSTAQPHVTFDIASAEASVAISGAGRGDEPRARTPQGRAMEALGRAGERALVPLKMALAVTCPECSHDSPSAHLYPLTLATSFTWVAVMSTIIAAVVTRWGELLCIPSSFLGMYVVAIGAEIPDTIQSVTVAKRGYGSMAVSNSTGSQIINILIGLGVPWLISNLAGRTVTIHGVSSLQVMASFQGVNVAVYFSLLLLPTVRTWRPGDHSKASLGKRKGQLLVGWYVLVLALCAPILLAVK